MFFTTFFRVSYLWLHFCNLVEFLWSQRITQTIKVAHLAYIILDPTDPVNVKISTQPILVKAQNDLTLDSCVYILISFPAR